jgi:hypothetical protein
MERSGLNLFLGRCHSSSWLRDTSIGLSLCDLTINTIVGKRLIKHDQLPGVFAIRLSRLKHFRASDGPVGGGSDSKTPVNENPRS